MQPLDSFHLKAGDVVPAWVAVEFVLWLGAAFVGSLAGLLALLDAATVAPRWRIFSITAVAAISSLIMMPIYWRARPVDDQRPVVFAVTHVPLIVALCAIIWWTCRRRRFNAS